MAADTPFANLDLPSFDSDEGPVDSPPDVLGLAQFASSELGHGGGGGLARRSLDAAFAQEKGRAGDRAAAPADAAAPGGGLLARSHTAPNPCDVGEMLEHINTCKLAGQKPPCGGEAAAALARAASGGPTTITDGANRNFRWIQPSGARQPGQGCEDVEQGIVHVEQTPSGGAVLRITLLAAGFIIGPSGSSIRDICRLCCSDIKSWTCEPDGMCSRPTRQFRVEGPPLGVARALGVMCDAVERYKELCEGKFAGQAVPRIQHVSGVDFSYQPPPRNIVPFAASLKSQGSAKRQGSGRLSSHGSCHGRPPAGPSYKGALSRASSTSGSLPPTPAQPHPPSADLTRSNSLPPLPRAAGSPAPGDAHTSRPNSRASAAAPVAAAKEEQGPTTAPHEEAAGSDEGAADGTLKLPSLAGSEPLLPSPFGAAGAQEQGQGGSAAGHSNDSRPSSPSRGSDGGRERMSRRGSAEYNAQLPAPAKTFDKEDVLRTVFAGVGQAQPPTPAVHDPSTGMLPAWVQQQLALQQHQQQLAATAAAAQALFPTQGSLLSELAGMGMPCPAAGGGLLAGSGGGGSPPQHPSAEGQLQVALAAMGLAGGHPSCAMLGLGTEAGQQSLMGGEGAAPQGLLRAGGSGDWSGLGAMQASMMANTSPFNTNGASLLGLAAPGMLPGTPNPAPLPPTPFPSPDVPDHRQILEALQALSASSPGSFGPVGSHGQLPGGRPPSGYSSPSPAASAALLSPDRAPTGALGATHTAPGSLATSLASAFELAAPAPMGRGGQGQGAGQLSAFAAPFTAFGSPGILARDPALAAQGEAFMSTLSPGGSGAPYSLPRASSLADPGPSTQPAGGLLHSGSMGRSSSMPLHQAVGQQGPWASLLGSAVEGEGITVGNRSPGAERL